MISGNLSNVPYEIEFETEVNEQELLESMEIKRFLESY